MYFCIVKTVVGTGGTNANTGIYGSKLAHFLFCCIFAMLAQGGPMPTPVFTVRNYVTLSFAAFLRCSRNPQHPTKNKETKA